MMPQILTIYVWVCYREHAIPVPYWLKYVACPVCLGKGETLEMGMELGHG